MIVYNLAYFHVKWKHQRCESCPVFLRFEIDIAMLSSSGKHSFHYLSFVLIGLI